MNKPLGNPSAELAALRKLAPRERISAIRGQRAERVFQVERNAVDENARTAWLSIASERPYERWWGIEVLDHNANSIRDERLRAGAALLVGHDPDDQVGVVEKFEITPQKKLRILARFGRSARAEEIWQDVLDGIRRNASVGYIIHDLVLEKSEEGVNTYRVTDWEPLEGSLVSIPADPGVGVGRGYAKSTGKGKRMEQEHNDEFEEEERLTRSQRRRQNQSADKELNRIQSLLRCGENFADMGGEEVARELIKDPKADAETFRIYMRARMDANPSIPTETAQFALEKVLQNSAPGDNRPFYGEGLRAEIPHSKLNHFTGPGGEQKAFIFGQWLKAQAGNDDAARYCRDAGVPTKRYMSSTTNTAGGFLVPDEISGEIIRNMDMHGVFRQESRVWPMGSDVLNVPKRTSGVSASFLVNDTETSESDAAFGNVGLLAKEAMTKTVITKSLMEDSVIDLGDYVAGEIAEAFALLEDNCGFNGDATSTYGGMTGLVTRIAGAAGGQITAATDHDTVSEIDAADLASVIAALPQYAQAGGRWYMSSAMYGAIVLRLLLAGGGNTTKSLEAGSSANPMFAGYPVVFSPLLPSNLTADYSSAPMLYFGNLRRAAAFGDRRQIALTVDPFTLAGKGQVRIIGSERFDIVVHDYGDATTAGPVVALYGH